MPTYGYKCEECGIRFERFQHFSEEPVRVCPECGHYKDILVVEPRVKVKDKKK